MLRYCWNCASDQLGTGEESNGCARLINDQMVELYDRVPLNSGLAGGPALRVLVLRGNARVFAAPDRPHWQGRLWHPRGYRLLWPETVHWAVCKTAYGPRCGACEYLLLNVIDT